MTIVVIMPTLAISNYALQVDGISKGKAYLDIVRCVDRVDGNLGLISSAIWSDHRARCGKKSLTPEPTWDSKAEW